MYCIGQHIKLKNKRVYIVIGRDIKKQIYLVREYDFINTRYINENSILTFDYVEKEAINKHA